MGTRKKKPQPQGERKSSGRRQYDEVADSGKREEFDTGARRDTREGKGRFDLISPIGLRRLALHYENGAKKYGDDNWQKGMPLKRFIDSMLRHLNGYLEGDREEDHMAAVAWNAFSFMHISEKIASGAMPDALNDVGEL